MDKLVDQIVGEVLSQGTTEDPAGLNRPNYQRKARPCSPAETGTATVPPPFPPAGSPQGKTVPAGAGRVPPPFPPEEKGCNQACAVCEDCCRDLEPGQTLPDLTLDPEQALRWIRLQNGGMEE